MVEEELKSLARRYKAHVDYTGFEDLMRRRAEGEAITIAKAPEANFDAPANGAESKIKTYIDEYREQMEKKWQSALFAEKTAGGRRAELSDQRNEEGT
jgi:hypothetical protein